MIRYLKPTLRDIEQMQRLVAPYVTIGTILKREDDEVATNIRSYIVAKNGDELVGYLALHIHTKELAEIRSFIVKECYRHQGIGKALVHEAKAEASRLGIAKILTLTYENLKSFFHEEGFVDVQKQDIPQQKIWADCIKCIHFPTSCSEYALIYETLE
jgi:amino-acid N-acetyltransferase